MVKMMELSSIDSLVQAILNAAGNFILKRIKKVPSLVIEHPRNGQRIDLPKRREDDGGFKYRVDGRLSRIDPNQELWLLNQNVTTGKVWPQSCDNVTLYKESDNWTAHVYLYPGKTRILAVLAPPTAQQLFRYYFYAHDKYSKKCEKFEPVWLPLRDVPKECRVQDMVDIEVPTN